MRKMRFIVILIKISMLYANTQVNAFANTNGGSLDAPLATMGIQISDSKDFLMSSNKERKGSTLTFFAIQSRHKNGGDLEIEITYPLEKLKAETIAATKIKIIKNSFNNQPTPYADELSNTKSCPQSAKPKIFKIENTFSLEPALIATASERFGWGECQNDGNLKIGIIAFYYHLHEKKLVRLTYFIDKNKYSENKVRKLLSSVNFIK